MDANDHKRTGPADHKGRSQAPCLAILGTASDVGKSVVATALCRIFADRGLRVAPFKAQNMSNNSGVTPEGLEMGRAQIVQAEAARIAPHVDMNPVLLKPTTDVGSQVVLKGSVWKNTRAREYYTHKQTLFRESCAALDRLRAAYDLVIMEGAGACAEVNLLAHDFVNLRCARYAEAPVVLVADIHRGGVFAQIVGTLACLDPAQQSQIRGFVINRFRGDAHLFQGGVEWIEIRTQKPCFGVLPWYDHFRIEAEDSVVIEKPAEPSASHGRPTIGVIRLPHIANFTDFEPLSELQGADLVYLHDARPLNTFRAVILPGSKNTRSDLEWLHTAGWTQALKAYASDQGHILGICGGYQMLGARVRDPQGIEGEPGETPGLDLLPVETVLKAPKTTTRTRFTWDGHEGRGYEIHMGQTRFLGGRPLLRISSRNGQPCQASEGCASTTGHTLGTYIHGLFDSPRITRHWMDRIGLGAVGVHPLHGPAARDRAYDQLAEHALAHLDITGIADLIQPRAEKERP